MRNCEAELRKKGLGRGINLVKCVSIMTVVVECREELLKSEFVRGWVNHVLVDYQDQDMQRLVFLQPSGSVRL